MERKEMRRKVEALRSEVARLEREIEADRRGELIAEFARIETRATAARQEGDLAGRLRAIEEAALLIPKCSGDEDWTLRESISASIARAAEALVEEVERAGEEVAS